MGPASRLLGGLAMMPKGGPGGSCIFEEVGLRKPFERVRPLEEYTVNRNVNDTIKLHIHARLYETTFSNRLPRPRRAVDRKLLQKGVNVMTFQSWHLNCLKLEILSRGLGLWLSTFDSTLTTRAAQFAGRGRAGSSPRTHATPPARAGKGALPLPKR